MKPEYEKIISIPHHEPMNHIRMPRMKRAAQFAPFDALQGYDEAIIETARETEEKKILSDDEKEKINRVLSYLREHIKERMRVKMTCFIPDARKKGGSYSSLTGVVRKIDEMEEKIILDDGTIISFDNIISIEITE